MPFYTVLLVAAWVRTVVATGVMIFAGAGRREWRPMAHGASDICCALLLRACFDPGYRQTLGAGMWPLFVFALLWSIGVWVKGIWSLAGSDDEAPPHSSVLGALGIGISTGVRKLAGVVWHVCFVAPSLACAAFMLFGITEELPPR